MALLRSAVAWKRGPRVAAEATSRGHGTSLEVRELRHAYGSEVALQPLSLEVEPGESIAIVGSSGSGKTTLLRILGGYIQPVSGSVLIGGRDVTSVAPQARNVGMVFQNYALFPHMRVDDNVAYGLRARRVDREAVRTRVDQALELVAMQPFARRYPHELSGGQQQRVALARAIVLRPSLLLMDEPLGALDQALRDRMAIEIRRLQRQLRMTMVYVTHDQAEAFAMGDRVLILEQGSVIGAGTPEDVYYRPNCIAAARFIGHHNLIEGRVVSRSQEAGFVRLVVRVGDELIESHVQVSAATSIREDQDVALCVPFAQVDVAVRSRTTGRPARDSVRGRVTVLGEVTERRFGGLSTFVTVRLCTGTDVVALEYGPRLEVGTAVEVSWPPNVQVVAKDT
jgi:ABC-type Fe3+/spermidine/putrescine transport system ATPase subunit